MLSKKIGIDLGTSTVLVYVKGEGIVLNEPSLMAIDEHGDKVMAVGSAARELLKKGGSLKSVRPVRDGDGMDYKTAGTMLQHVIWRIAGRQRIFRPDVMLSVSSRVTGVERRVVLEATMQAGARTAYLIEKPLAAAIGAKLQVGTTPGIAVSNLGAGSLETAVIVMGEVVASGALDRGSAGLDAAISDRVFERSQVRLDEKESERMKLELASALPPANGGKAQAMGTTGTGQRVPVEVSAEETHGAIAAELEAFSSAIKEVLDRTPAENQFQVNRNGLHLAGGGARLTGLASFLSSRLGIPVHLAENPQACVAIGTGMALDNMQLIRRGQHYIT
jgi:rod shape-determining protein MreB